MNTRPETWRISPNVTITLDRPRIIGILNVTPDSFSDGGRYTDPSRAVDVALRMIDEGAEMIDVGGESTRPGAERINAEQQNRRVLPVIERLRSATSVPISIDTTLAAVARAALDTGATVINDVSGGRDDAAMFELAALRQCGLVLMHRRVPPDADSFSDAYLDPPVYDDVVKDVADFLVERAALANRAGVARECICIDPGLGFGKSVGQNYEIIRRIGELTELAYPVLCAASRKSFIGAAANVQAVSERVAGSVAVALHCRHAGVRLFRVHDVAAHAQALRVAEAIEAAFSWSAGVS